MNDCFLTLPAISEIECGVKILGASGFRGVLTKGGSTTLIVGVVKGGRFVRVHTNATAANLEEAKRVHEAFLKTMKLRR